MAGAMFWNEQKFDSHHYPPYIVCCMLFVLLNKRNVLES